MSHAFCISGVRGVLAMYAKVALGLQDCVCSCEWSSCFRVGQMTASQHCRAELRMCLGVCVLHIGPSRFKPLAAVCILVY